MNRRSELEGIVRSWLRENRHEDADRVLDMVLAELDTTPQRRAGWLARRFPFMKSNTIRFGFAAVAVIALAFLGWRFLPGGGTGGEPTATPTLMPSPTPVPALSGQRDLPAGTYEGALTKHSLGFFVTVPEGWDALESDGIGASDNEPPELAHGFLLWDVGNLYADPLSPGLGGMDPPVGPTADDLVEALVSHDGWTTTTPTDVTVGGYDGQLLELTVPEDADFTGCDAFGNTARPFAIWSEPGAGNSWRCMQGPGQTDYVYVLDVEGRRVVITLIGYPDWSGSYLDDLQGMVDSLEFFER